MAFLPFPPWWYLIHVHTSQGGKRGFTSVSVADELIEHYFTLRILWYCQFMLNSVASLVCEWNPYQVLYYSNEWKLDSAWTIELPLALESVDGFLKCNHMDIEAATSFFRLFNNSEIKKYLQKQAVLPLLKHHLQTLCFDVTSLFHLGDWIVSSVFVD